MSAAGKRKKVVSDEQKSLMPGRSIRCRKSVVERFSAPAAG